MGRSQVQFNRTHGRRPGGRGRGRGQEQSQPQKQQQQNAKQLEKLGDNSWRFQEDRKDDDDVHGNNNNEDDQEDLRLNQFLEQPQQKYIYSSSSASTSEYRDENESSASMINLVELSSWWPQGLVAKLALLPTTKRLRLPSHIVATFAEQEIDDKEYEILQQRKNQLQQFEQDPSIWKGTFSQPSNIATTTQSHNTNESDHVTGKVDAVAITLNSSSVDDAKTSVSMNTTNMDPSTSATTGDNDQWQRASEEKTNSMENDDGEDDLDAWLDSVIS